MAVEKAAKKLEKKQKRLAAADNKELQVLMSQREVFQLPSGQEVEKEAAQPPDLQIIQTRIKDIIDVLKDFANKRAEGASRQEYLECLRRDLCSYYNYNGKFLDQASVFGRLWLGLGATPPQCHSGLYPIQAQKALPKSSSKKLSKIKKDLLCNKIKVKN